MPDSCTVSFKAFTVGVHAADIFELRSVTAVRAKRFRRLTYAVVRRLQRGRPAIDATSWFTLKTLSEDT